MPTGIGRGLVRNRDPDRRAARVAHRDRPVVLERRAQHVDEHRLVARGHQHHVGECPQERDVVRAVVGRPVVADEAGAVHAERDVEVLQAHVVDTVIAALEEGRVDRRDRAQALERQARGEQHGVLLGDADVEVLVGHLGPESTGPSRRPWPL